MKKLKEIDVSEVGKIINPKNDLNGLLVDVAIINGVPDGLVDRLYGESAKMFSLTPYEREALMSDLRKNNFRGDKHLYIDYYKARSNPADRESIFYQQRPITGKLFNFNRGKFKIVEAFSNVYSWAATIGLPLVGLDDKPKMIVFRYGPNNEPFRISEHEDPSITLAFAPRGEPLEVKLGDEYVAPKLTDNQALVIARGVPHRVQNLTPNERYSAIMAF